jgi:hypothetical protein
MARAAPRLSFFYCTIVQVEHTATVKGQESLVCLTP